MDLAVIIPAVFAGGVVVAVATLWASFGPSTKPISTLLQDTSLSHSTPVGRERTPQGSQRKRKKADDSPRPSGANQSVDVQDVVESEQGTVELDDEVGGVEPSPRQPSELSSSSSSEDVPGSAVHQSMLASAMLDTANGGEREEGEGGRGEGEENREQDEWVIVGERQASPVDEQ